MAILTGLASAALYDGIKYVIEKRIAPSEKSLLQRLEFKEIQQDDGRTLLVVLVKEE